MIEDKWPSKHRIRTIRDSDGFLLGFGMTTPGSQIIVHRFRDMRGALAKMTETCDFIYGPLRVYPEALT